MNPENYQGGPRQLNSRLKGARKSPTDRFNRVFAGVANLARNLAVSERQGRGSASPWEEYAERIDELQENRSLFVSSDKHIVAFEAVLAWCTAHGEENPKIQKFAAKMRKLQEASLKEITEGHDSLDGLLESSEALFPVKRSTRTRARAVLAPARRPRRNKANTFKSVIAAGGLALAVMMGAIALKVSSKQSSQEPEARITLKKTNNNDDHRSAMKLETPLPKAPAAELETEKKARPEVQGEVLEGKATGTVVPKEQRQEEEKALSQVEKLLEEVESSLAAYNGRVETMLKEKVMTMAEVEEKRDVDKKKGAYSRDEGNALLRIKKWGEDEEGNPELKEKIEPYSKKKLEELQEKEIAELKGLLKENWKSGVNVLKGLQQHLKKLLNKVKGESDEIKLTKALEKVNQTCAVYSGMEGLSEAYELAKIASKVMHTEAIPEFIQTLSREEDHMGLMNTVKPYLSSIETFLKADKNFDSLSENQKSFQIIAMRVFTFIRVLESHSKLKVAENNKENINFLSRAGENGLSISFEYYFYKGTSGLVSFELESLDNEGLRSIGKIGDIHYAEYLKLKKQRKKKRKK